MSSEVEFTGRTVEQAVEIACQHLDIKEEYLNFTVVREGSTGIFGLVGVKKAIIRVISQEKQIDRNETAFDNERATVDTESSEVAPRNISAATRAGQEAVEKISMGITAGESAL